jgi:hypothetical protein
VALEKRSGAARRAADRHPLVVVGWRVGLLALLALAASHLGAWLAGRHSYRMDHLETIVVLEDALRQAQFLEVISRAVVQELEARGRRSPPVRIR